MILRLSPRRLGALGEIVAAAYLRSLGYQILYRNLKTKAGEIDIVALQRRTIAIVEVKTRRRQLSTEISPVEAVDYAKRRQISRLTSNFAHHHSLELRRLRIKSVRFDIVSILAEPYRSPLIRHVPDAFSK